MFHTHLIEIVMIVFIY